jgi:hypothetical protein
MNRHYRAFVAVSVATCLLVPASACSTTQHRVSSVEPDFDQVAVHATIEKREVKKTMTWKPIVTTVILSLAAAASGMIVYGFYYPEYRPVAITGIVIGAVLPFATIPIVATPNTPWMRTKESAWTPAGSVEAELSLRGRDEQNFATSKAESDATGHLDVAMTPILCTNPRWGDLGEVSLVFHVRGADDRTLALPVDRLAGRVPCVTAGPLLSSVESTSPSEEPPQDPAPEPTTPEVEDAH